MEQIGCEDPRGNILSGMITLDDFLSNPPVPPTLLLGEWLSAKTCTMIHAASGLGKSWFAMGIAMAVAGAGEIVKWKAEQAKHVLYVDGEMSAQSRYKRFNMLAKKMTFSDESALGKNLHIIDPESGIKIDTASSIDHYRSIIMEHNIELLVIDNIRTLADLKDENSAESWNKINRFLQTMRLYCAVIIVHHDGKRDGYSGSSNAITVLDNQIGLTRLPVYNCSSQKLIDANLKFNYEFHKVRDSFDGGKSGCIGFNDAYGWLDDTSRSLQTIHDLFETNSLAESGEFNTWKELAGYLGITEHGLKKRRKRYKEQFSADIKLITPHTNETSCSGLATVLNIDLG